MKATLISIISLVLTLSVIQGQEAVTTSGSDATGIGGSSSYSVGQVVYTTNSGTNLSVTQGVQQPYEILALIGIEQAKDINLSCKIYPNPITEFLNLVVENYDNANLSFQIVDMNGKLIENKSLTENSITIPTTNLVPSTYFLKVIDNKKVIKTFKVIKNK